MCVMSDDGQNLLALLAVLKKQPSFIVSEAKQHLAAKF